MKKICLNQQTIGYLLRSLGNNTQPFLPTYSAVLSGHQRGQHCPVCSQLKGSERGKITFKAFLTDIKNARRLGNDKELRELFNRVTSNDFTTRWEFILDNEVVSL